MGTQGNGLWESVCESPQIRQKLSRAQMFDFFSLSLNETAQSYMKVLWHQAREYVLTLFCVREKDNTI